MQVWLAWALLMLTVLGAAFTTWGKIASLEQKVSDLQGQVDHLQRVVDYRLGTTGQ